MITITRDEAVRFHKKFTISTRCAIETAPWLDTEWRNAKKNWERKGTNLENESDTSNSDKKIGNLECLNTAEASSNRQDESSKQRDESQQIA